jgi:hypothetical protein
MKGDNYAGRKVARIPRKGVVFLNGRELSKNIMK